MKTLLPLLSIGLLCACTAEVPPSSSSSSYSSQFSSTPVPASQSSQSSVEEVPGDPPEATFTMADIEAHASKTSCYTTVNGGVYDITSYIPFHPGGEREIMKICGRDGTSMFMRKHGDDRQPQEQLASLRIGILVK